MEFSVEDLPRASELGGIYTTYILWAISPDGHVDSLGEIKRSGSSFVDSKLDVTTPLQTFAMILTAEPHFSDEGAEPHGGDGEPAATAAQWQSGGDS